MNSKDFDKIRQTMDAFKDGDAFEKGLRNKVASMSTSLAKLNPAAIAGVVRDFVGMAGDVIKFVEYQETERTRINAERDEIVAGIQARKEVILEYLKMSFDERGKNFAMLFANVDKAIASNNTDQLAIVLDSINKLAAESPFKALASIEATQKALEDKNHEWDF